MTMFPEDFKKDRNRQLNRMPAGDGGGNVTEPAYELIALSLGGTFISMTGEREGISS